LGKGLGALIPGADAAGSQSGSDIEIDRIALNPYQPRESIDQDRLRELADSIRMHGVLQPVLVRPKGQGAYELVAGERRLRAAAAAGLTKVPATVRDLTDEQSLQVALIENIQREDINAIDAALAYKRLVDDFGMSQEELAVGLGKSRSAIANTLRLLNLPGSVRDDLRSGAITEGHARAILSLDGERDQVALCDRIKAVGMSVREAERLAKRWTPELMRTKDGRIVSRETLQPPQEPNDLYIEARLREIFRTKARLVRMKDRGRIEIEFYSEDDLERILNFLLGG
jgi:ParB family transcriptional regulator, chromosome partitioning protein